MATLVKIRGLERVETTGGVVAGRGFRVPAPQKQFPAGVKATKTLGAGNAAVVYTAKYGGTYGNNISVAHVVAGNNTAFSIAVTYQAATGNPTITVNAATDGGGLSTTTANAAAAAVNAHAEASQFVTAAAGGTGASVITAVAAGAMSTGTDVGTGQPINRRVANNITVVVDVDDPAVAKMLKRNAYRYISLGAA
jgi:hypothetical protein